MVRSFARFGLALGALTLGTNFVGIARGASGEDREIPAQLVNDPEPEDLNGACSKCRVNSLKAAQTATQDGATLELYYDDEQGDLLGVDVELMILLFDGRTVFETIEAVDLPRGEISVLELDGVTGWSWWADVRHVWVEVVRTGG